jgi:hypothetical protein
MLIIPKKRNVSFNIICLLHLASGSPSGGSDLKNLDKWVGLRSTSKPFPYPFVKLFKSLAPGRAAGGFEIFFNKINNRRRNS